MTDGMVERVARSLLAAERGDPVGPDDGWEWWCNHHPPFREHRLRVASEAIASMRTPTEAMIEAAKSVEDIEDGDDKWIMAVWQAMIDAALERQP